MILSKEEENDNEVRREDQEQINEFGRLNARLHEARDEIATLKVWTSTAKFFYQWLFLFICMVFYEFLCR